MLLDPPLTPKPPELGAGLDYRRFKRALKKSVRYVYFAPAVGCGLGRRRPRARRALTAGEFFGGRKAQLPPSCLATRGASEGVGGAQS
jgi:hypothetical protein